MGMLDKFGTFSARQAVTALGATPSTNSYDSGNANVSAGGNDNLWLNVQVVDQATRDPAATTGDSTVMARLEHSGDNTTWSTLIEGAAVPLVDLVPGAIVLAAKVPPNAKQYTRVSYVVGNTALTGGTFNAFYALGNQNSVARPSGFSVA